MKRIFIKLILTALFFFLLFPSIENKIFSVQFVDESDNFVSGKYLLQGEKLYSSLFTQHQPLPMVISAGIQKIVPMNSLALLVKRHREFVFTYSFLWACLLVIIFGIWTLAPVAVIEITKHFFYGNLFLAESLTLYPLIFLVILILKTVIPSDPDITSGESRDLPAFGTWKIPPLIHYRGIGRNDALYFFIGLLSSLIMLFLLPLWPLLGFLLILMLSSVILGRSQATTPESEDSGRAPKGACQNDGSSSIIRHLLFFSLGFLPLFIIVSFFMSWDKYIFDIFVTTQRYYLPGLAQTGEKISLSGFFAPLLSFTWTNIHSPVLRIIQSLSLIYIMLLAVLIFKSLFKKPPDNNVILVSETHPGFQLDSGRTLSARMTIKPNREFSLAVISFVILGLAHIRFLNLETSFHNGFHLLPWFGLLVTMVFYLPNYLIRVVIPSEPPAGGESRDPPASGTWKIPPFSRNDNIKNSVFLKLYFIILPLLIFIPVKDYFLNRTDPAADLYVNFSRKFDFGEAVRIMKNNNDRLFVAPDDYLIYWQADSKHFDSTTSYYPWMEKIPEVSGEINFLFETNPPEFFYCECGQLSLKKYLAKFKRATKDGKETDLYVLKDKIREITEEQKEKLSYYHFSLD